jgi:hypothetical protein
MTRPTRSTDRPFTVIICTCCSSERVLSVLGALRSVIKRCRNGVLVRTGCLLGPLTCASRPTGEGVMVILQPCSPDRTPAGSAFWLGPVEDIEDITQLCAFIERGEWEFGELAGRLCNHRDWLANASRTN